MNDVNVVNVFVLLFLFQVCLVLPVSSLEMLGTGVLMKSWRPACRLRSQLLPATCEHPSLWSHLLCLRPSADGGMGRVRLLMQAGKEGVY